MPAAARLGDPTSHGTPLSPGAGSPDVLIGGKPAWRVTRDKHTCPRHGGGMVAAGSGSVYVNGAPAARANDTVVEPSAPPNTITSGCPNVSIGG
jgi:uncharacterized Zn-binding protein involved in type VI secretion